LSFERLRQAVHWHYYNGLQQSRGFGLIIWGKNQSHISLSFLRDLQTIVAGVR